LTERKRNQKQAAFEVQTFSVPYALDEIIDNISIRTKGNESKATKEEIIKQAFQFHSQGNIQEAAKHYQSFIDQGFSDHRVFSHYGIILKSLGKLEDAEVSYRKAIEINPNFAQAHYNLGNILKDLGKLQEAEKSYRKAIEINPKYANAHLNLGTILSDLGKLQEAEKSYRKAIKIKPNYAEAHYNLGIILSDLGKLQEANLAYKKSLEIEPNRIQRISTLIHNLSKLCMWDEIEKYSTYIHRLVVEGELVNPMDFMYIEDNPFNHLRRAVKYNKKFRNKEFTKIIYQKDKKINIGYFSSDYRNHPISHLLTRVLELHDKSKFKIYAYSLSNIKDNYTERIKNAVFCYREISSLSDLEIVTVARNDKIDIAIDLNGYTKNNRRSIFCYRVAPIQINYIGFPGSMGSKSYDYILADKILIPEKNKKFYTEKVIYHPISFMPNDNTKEISKHNFSKEELGLPTDGFVFTCFNSIVKITRKEFNIWMSLLLKVEGSVLWLMKPNETAQKNLYSELNNIGINKERLVFAPRMELNDHLSRLKKADLFLDTFNYNAGTTASDALWAGVPLITMSGKSFSSRMGASILNACNLNELITHSEKEYELLAYELANNKKRLESIRKKLNKKQNYSFFDSERYTIDLENIYLNITKGNDQ